jgi:hypothetical protein
VSVRIAVTPRCYWVGLGWRGRRRRVLVGISTRGFLYWLARLLGDAEAVKKGQVGPSA